MEPVILDENMQPVKLIEGYDSLNWAERFNTVGEFEFQSTNINKFINLLPEGTVISLRESNVAMRVETHRINRPKNKPATLIISGRSFESILSQRQAIKDFTTNDWVVNVRTPSDVAFFIINQVCVFGTADTHDIFPEETVQWITPPDYLATTGPVKAFTVERGNLLDVVLRLLQTEAKADATTTPATPAVVPHGIRAIRPNTSGTAIGMEIYTGVDRSDTVYFDGTRDLLNDGSYLFSKIGSATTAYVVGNGLAFKMDKTTTIASGLDRRVILVDATSSNLSDEASLKSQAEASLAEARETAIFDGSINQDISPYVYGVHYGLGDIVKLVGDYGLDEKARVTEYIRSEDASGVKSYPTLSTVPE